MPRVGQAGRMPVLRTTPTRQRRGGIMGLAEDIVKMLRDEGYRVTEAVRDAVDELIEVVEEETEGVVDDDDEAEDDPTE